MPDLSDLVDHPVFYVVALIVVIVLVATALALVIALTRLLLASLFGKGPSMADIRTAWAGRGTVKQAIAVSGAAELKAVIEQQIALAGTMPGPGQPAAERLATLDALHAEGRITASRLAELKAAIEAEQPDATA